MTDASLLEMAVWAIAILVLIPVLAVPAAWPLAAAIIVALLLSYYVGRELLDFEKTRRQGERGKIAEVRSRDRGDR